MYAKGNTMGRVWGSKAYEEYCWSKRIGGIFIEESSGAFAYGGLSVGDDSSYFIPAEITEEQILEAIEKSVKDNHDYLHDLVAKPENEIVYEPGRVY